MCVKNTASISESAVLSLSNTQTHTHTHTHTHGSFLYLQLYFVWFIHPSLHSSIPSVISSASQEMMRPARQRCYCSAWCNRYHSSYFITLLSNSLSYLGCSFPFRLPVTNSPPPSRLSHPSFFFFSPFCPLLSRLSLQSLYPSDSRECQSHSPSWYSAQGPEGQYGKCTGLLHVSCDSCLFRAAHVCVCVSWTVRLGFCIRWLFSLSVWSEPEFDSLRFLFTLRYLATIRRGFACLTL